MDGKKLVSISGVSVKHALGFFTDGCHKIYVAETNNDIETMHRLEYGEMHPMSALEKTFEGSCPLRFISWCDLEKPCIVPQCEKYVYFEYMGATGIVKSMVRFDD